MEDGFHLVQIHAKDFSDDGDVVLGLLRSNDVDYSVDVFRINIKTGEAVTVRKDLNGGQLEFLGLKDGRYLYIDRSRTSHYSASRDPGVRSSHLESDR